MPGEGGARLGEFGGGGWFVGAARELPEVEGAWFGSLGDGEHSVPRAELHGLLKLVQYTEGDVELVMDCLRVVD